MSRINKCRPSPEPRATAQALRWALELNIQWSWVDHSSALEIALETGLSTYDASYLWIS